LLHAGEAYATKTLEQGKPPKKVMDYGKGSYFGELALLKNVPRAANILAKVRLFVELMIDRLQVFDAGSACLQARSRSDRRNPQA
jgi:hypothetical protein